MKKLVSVLFMVILIGNIANAENLELSVENSSFLDQSTMLLMEIVRIIEADPIEYGPCLFEWIYCEPDNPLPLMILATSSPVTQIRLGILTREHIVEIAGIKGDIITEASTALSTFNGELIWVVPEEKVQVMYDAFSGKFIGERIIKVEEKESRASNQRRAAVILELRYALMGSDYKVGRVYNGYAAGDWDYINSNPGVRNAAKSRYIPGVYGWDGYGLGGYCKFFIGNVVRRGTGNFWIPSNQTLYDQGRHSRFTRPGDVLQKISGGHHTAGVVQILCYDSNGNVTGADVIDSNFIRSWTTGRHPLFSHGQGYSGLYNYRTWDRY